MFDILKKNEKISKKNKKSVDTGRRYVVFYSSAQGTGPAEAGAGERRRNLENDTERLRETTVNSEMS